MNQKLALILEKSNSFIAFKRDEILDSWGVPQSETKNVDSYGAVGGATLFGGAPCSILELPDIESIKACVASMEGDGGVDKKLESGLIIITPVGGQSTKKIRALVEKLGGTIHALTPEANKNKSIIAQDLLKETNLTRDVKDFLVHYIGDDYESLLSLVKTVRELTPAQQKRIDIEDLKIRLPQPPGSTPPWNIEKSLLSGDLTETIETYRRIAVHSAPTLVLAVLNNKFRLAYRVSSILDADPRANKSAVAEALKVPDNYPLKLAMDSARRLKLEKLQRIVHALATAESNIKGGSSADNEVTMEQCLVMVHLALHGR